MLFKMSEPNIPDTLLKKEVGRTFNCETRDIDNEGGHLLAKDQIMGPLATKLDDGDNSSPIIYYGISIPDINSLGSEGLPEICTDKVEALKIVKKYKKARFKAFKTKEEAVDFAVHGSDILVPTSPSVAESTESSSPVGEKPSPFKGLKAQDLVRLRKVIESGDLASFCHLVWLNPRYLVSSGDTPAILQEGSRYNALHVAAKAKNAMLCQAILKTVSDVSFVQMLYGDDTASCEDRAGILLDLYLNTPDKALNETPLHFAVKFGALAVAEMLLSYPQCDKFVKNKFGQTPRDMICSRVTTPDAALKRDLSSLLDDRYYVPVLRSEDNSMQPTIGDPFSPACPLVLKANPLTPRMEIRAYAGPMGRDEAVKFRKKWKTPPRMLRTPGRNTNAQPYMGSPVRNTNTQPYVGSPVRNTNSQSHIGSPITCDVRLQDTEKGLERVGRDLAQEFRVGWKEYWPFLNMFINLASEEGLKELEAYMKRRFEASEKDKLPNLSTSAKPESSGDGAISPMSDLCLAFKACSLCDNNVKVVRNEVKAFDHRGGDTNGDEALLNVMLNPGLNPFLYVEKSCQVFAKRISDGLALVGRSGRFGDSVCDMLHAEVRHLQDLVCSFKDDARFVSVDFNLVHSRISVIVALKLSELSSEELEFIILGLKSTVQPSKTLDGSFSDEEDGMNSSYRDRNLQGTIDHQKRLDGERGQMKCLAEFILSALDSPQEDGLIRTEEECMRIWADAVKCSCMRQNFVRNTRRGSSFKRSRYMPPKYAENGVTRRLTYEPDSDARVLDVAVEKEPDHDDSTDEEFFTPPTSPVPVSSNNCDDSDDDNENMVTPDEGPNVFIEGEVPSKLDLAVMQAIEGSDISPLHYPSIYRWRHLVLLHSELERAVWPSPKYQTSTPRKPWAPPVDWQKIMGPYSPLSPQLV